MPEGKRAQPEGTKCPMAALLPEAIFNYVLTVEVYVLCSFWGKMPENCERDRKVVKEPGKVRETMQMIFFPFMRSNISFFIHAFSWKNMREKAKTYTYCGLTSDFLSSFQIRLLEEIKFYSLLLSKVYIYTSKACVIIWTIFLFQPKSQILLRRKYCCNKVCSFWSITIIKLLSTAY